MKDRVGFGFLSIAFLIALSSAATAQPPTPWLNETERAKFETLRVSDSHAAGAAACRSALKTISKRSGSAVFHGRDRRIESFVRGSGRAAPFCCLEGWLGCCR